MRKYLAFALVVLALANGIVAFSSIEQSRPALAYDTSNCD
jgi:hypothetical protein